MPSSNFKQELFDQLLKLDNKNACLCSPKINCPTNVSNAHLPTLKTNIIKTIATLKKSLNILKPCTYVLMTIIMIFALTRIFFNNGIDLNKVAMCTLSAFNISTFYFIQKLKLKDLEKQVLIIEVLEQLGLKE